MKFFTRDWANGELDDDQAESAFDRYAAYVKQLHLPPAEEALANTSLHDALLERVRIDHESITLVLITGDLQHGYAETEISYSDPLAWGADVTLLEFFASRKGTEVLQHEIDRAGSRFVHRLLWESGEDTAITFTSVAVTHRARASRDPGPSSN